YLPHDPHVVEVVLAYLRELARLIKLENFAAFRGGRLARLDTQRPGAVVEADVSLRAQPPMVHRVKHSPHPILTEIDQRPRGNAMHQAAFEDKRTIEAGD